MPTVDETVLDACLGGAVVTATFDDESGEVSKVAYVVKCGVLTVNGLRPDKTPLVVIAGDSGSVSVAPGAVTMTKHPKGGWDCPLETQWEDRPHGGAGWWKDEDPAVLRQNAQELIAQRAIDKTGGA